MVYIEMKTVMGSQGAIAFCWEMWNVQKHRVVLELKYRLLTQSSALLKSISPWHFSNGSLEEIRC